MNSLSVVILSILEIGSPFILMNMGMLFHESLLIIIPALFGQCFPHPFRMSKKFLTLILVMSVGFFLSIKSISDVNVKALVYFLSVFACSASISSSYLSDDRLVPANERKIMKIIGYAMAPAVVLSPSFIFLMAYALSAVGIYKCEQQSSGRAYSTNSTKAFIFQNLGFIMEGFFSYCIMAIICFRASAAFSQLTLNNEVLGIVSFAVQSDIMILYASEIFTSVAFAIYKTASYYGVMPYAESESNKRKILTAVLLALSIFVQVRSIPAIGSALVFILTGFLFKEYISDEGAELEDDNPGETAYARAIGIIIAGNILLLLGGNFSLVLSASVVLILLSIFIKE